MPIVRTVSVVSQSIQELLLLGESVDGAWFKPMFDCLDALFADLEGRLSDHYLTGMPQSKCKETMQIVQAVRIVSQAMHELLLMGKSVHEEWFKKMTDSSKELLDALGARLAHNLPFSEEKHHEPIFNEFDFKTQIKEFSFWLIVGESMQNNTKLAQLISQVRDDRIAGNNIVIAGNANTKKLWSTIVDPAWMQIHEAYTLDPKEEGGSAGKATRILAEVIRVQHLRVYQCHASGTPFPQKWEINLWIDGCGDMKKFMHSDEMKWLSSNSNRIMANVFVTTENYKHAAAECRENCDGIISTETADASTIECIHKEHLSALPFKLVQAVFQGATQKGGCLVINTQKMCDNIETVLFFAHCDFLRAECDAKSKSKQVALVNKEEDHTKVSTGDIVLSLDEILCDDVPFQKDGVTLRFRPKKIV